MSATSDLANEALCVRCDLCVEVKTPALKTCLKCEISMCAQHLETHLTTPVLLQTHPLTKPVDSGSSSHMASKCSAHGKLVEYYCLNDHMLVCMSCAIEEGHQQHNMKTLRTAHMELESQLKEEKRALDERQNQAKVLEMWHLDQTQTLENCVSHLMETGLALKDLVFTSLQSSVSARLEAVQRAQQAISLALKEEDHFNFLQTFASVHKAIQEARGVDLKKGLELRPDRIKLIKEIRKDGQNIEKQVHKLQTKFLAFADPDAQNEPDAVSEQTFDPQTLSPGMTLSKDLKKVFYNFSVPGNAASHRAQTVRCLQTTEKGNLRWFLNLSEYFDWTIGLCDSRARDGCDCKYGLMKQDNWLSSLKPRDDNDPLRGNEFYKTLHSDTYGRCTFTEIFRKTLKESHDFHVSGPWKVEVIWDFTSQQLIFYSRNKPTKGSLLCELKVDRYRHMLCPFITVEYKSATPQNTGNSQTYRSTSWNNHREPLENSFTEIVCALKQ